LNSGCDRNNLFKPFSRFSHVLIGLNELFDRFLNVELVRVGVSFGVFLEVGDHLASILKVSCGIKNFLFFFLFGLSFSFFSFFSRLFSLFGSFLSFFFLEFLLLLLSFLFVFAQSSLTFLGCLVGLLLGSCFHGLFRFRLRFISLHNVKIISEYLN